MFWKVFRSKLETVGRDLETKLNPLKKLNSIVSPSGKSVGLEAQLKGYASHGFANNSV